MQNLQRGCGEGSPAPALRSQRRFANGDTMTPMSTSVKCAFCTEKITVEGETLPIHESAKGSGQRCDGSGLPIESMAPDKAPTGGVLTDSGNTGKDA